MQLSDLEKVLNDKLTKALQNLPRVLAEEAVNFTKDNFKKQGFQAEALQVWKPRKPGSPRNKGRALLIDTGRLLRSIKVISVSGFTAKFGSTGVPYAKAHNDGVNAIVNIPSFKRAKLKNTANTTEGKRKFRKQTLQSVSTVRSHSRKMNLPQRKFLGTSIFLQRQLVRHARLIIARAIK
jgi:phage gpG-like protein